MASHPTRITCAARGVSLREHPAARNTSSNRTIRFMANNNLSWDKVSASDARLRHGTNAARLAEKTGKPFRKTSAPRLRTPRRRVSALRNVAHDRPVRGGHARERSDQFPMGFCFSLPLALVTSRGGYGNTRSNSGSNLRSMPPTGQITCFSAHGLVSGS